MGQFQYQGVLTVFGTIVAFLISASSIAGKDDNKEKDWLEILETSANMIVSFDVDLAAKQTLYATTLIQNGKLVPDQYTVLQKPEVELFRSRQVFSKGKRRVERLDSTNGNVYEIVTSDEKVQRIWYPGSYRANLDRPGGPVLPPGHDYLQTYITLSGLDTIPMILRRRDATHSSRGGDRNQYVILESDPAKRRGEAFAGRGIRVFLDTGANMLPSIVELYDIVDGERVVYNRLTVTKRKTIAPGIEVPIEAITEGYISNKTSNRFRHLLGTIELTIDPSRSRWNTSLPDDTFTVRIPAGTKVIDKVREVAFVTGRADPGKNLDDLAASSRNLVTNIRPVQPRPAHAWAWWCGGVGTIGLLWLGYFFMKRRLSRSRSSS